MYQLRDRPVVVLTLIPQQHTNQSPLPSPPTGSFSVLPNMIFVSFGSSASAASETHIIRMGQGLDVYKLRKVNHLCNQLLDKRIKTLHDAINKVE